MTEILHDPTQLPVPPATAPVVSVTPTVIAPVRRTSVGKRALDLAIAIPAAMITLPIVLIFAAVSFALYHETPFFRQPRLGHGGREFTFWKIRTLPSIAPDTADKYQLR